MPVEMNPTSVTPSDQLRKLNSRLSVYIDQVRCTQTERMLAEENENRISQHINNARQAAEEEITKLKNLYETELGDTRNLIDETVKENAKLQLDSQRLGKEVGHLKAELEKLNHKCNKAENEFALAQKKILELENRNNELVASLQQLKSEMEKLKEEEQENTEERKKLREQVPELQKQLESELLIRADLENRSQTLKKDLELKQEVFEKEMNEMRKNRENEISEMKSQLQQRHETNVQTSLQELRKLYETDAKNTCEDHASRFENRILELEEAADKQRNVARTHYEELRETRTCLDGFKMKLSELESSNSDLKLRVIEMKEDLDKERNQHTKAMASCKEKIKHLSEKFNVQLQKTTDLNDNQVNLRKEIEHYRQLLEGEKSRPKLMPKNKPPLQKAIKRKDSPDIGRPMKRDCKQDPTSNIQDSRSDSPFYSDRPAKRRRTSDASSESSVDFFISSRIRGDIRVTDVNSPRKGIRLRKRDDKKADLTKKLCIIM